MQIADLQERLAALVREHSEMAKSTSLVKESELRERFGMKDPRAFRRFVKAINLKGIYRENAGYYFVIKDVEEALEAAKVMP